MKIFPLPVAIIGAAYALRAIPYGKGFRYTEPITPTNL